MELLAGPRGTVVQAYLNSRPTATEPHDAVLVRSAEPEPHMRAHPWQIGRIAACGFLDTADVVVTPLATRRFPGYYLGVLLEGRGTLTQPGADGAEHTITLGADRVGIYSRMRPFRLQINGPYHYLVLEVTPEALGVHQSLLAGATTSEELAAAPSAALLTGLLGQLSSLAPRMSPALRMQAGDAVTSLLAGHLRAGTTPCAARGPLDEILLWIEERVGDPDLSPHRIAAAHHISTRYLHKLFNQQALTVAGYVRARRLELVRRDLGDPGLRDVSVSALGRRWGITDASQLSKAFRGRYGTTPRGFREQAATVLADDGLLTGGAG
ncbi:helix-turn-helix domain-containing protein [Blastococcus haudaquaticus]|uniref:Transcriptional regulator, AraC family n=1 Tax=Blastococcus haudaquaticus TaxID=1938745 RepID=A0A286H3X1_9ACTN|nr:helix-turn-helix domain-containing protein [Blastococcus haudaquaticus]SOE02451.1 transcriptional regulator, AraC family [Blastococcus haudaquaticus]